MLKNVAGFGDGRTIFTKAYICAHEERLQGVGFESFQNHTLGIEIRIKKLSL